MPDYKNYEGLNNSQTKGIIAGLTRKQVKHGWFQSIHALAAEKKISYEAYEGLNNSQTKGIIAGLTRKQVRHGWFESIHALAAENEKPYEQYKGLNNSQTKGIIAGLERKQVEGLNSAQISIMQREALPNASILRGLPRDRWESAVTAYKDKVTQKVAFVCYQNQLSPQLPQDLVQRIGAFI